MTNKVKIDSIEHTEDIEAQKDEAQNQKTKFGKFDSPDELLLAYNALESEFTKRCQLVKQLQAELAALSAQESGGCPENAENSEAVSQEGEVKPEAVAEAVTPPAPDMKEIDVLGEIMRNIADYAEALSAVPEIMAACIAQYKRNLMDADRIRGVVSPSGMAVIMPAARPRTLSEAKRIADNLLG